MNIIMKYNARQVSRWDMKWCCRSSRGSRCQPHCQVPSCLFWRNHDARGSRRPHGGMLHVRLSQVYQGSVWRRFTNLWLLASKNWRNLLHSLRTVTAGIAMILVASCVMVTISARGWEPEKEAGFEGDTSTLCTWATYLAMFTHDSSLSTSGVSDAQIYTPSTP